MSIPLNTFSPNTQAKSSEVNSNFSVLKTAVEESSYRAFTWGIKGTLAVGDEQGMKYIVPQGRTFVKIWAKTGSGTATIRLQKGTSNIKSSFAVSAAVGSTTLFDSDTITSGQVLTLDLIAVSGSDLFVTLESQSPSVV